MQAYVQHATPAYQADDLQVQPPQAYQIPQNYPTMNLYNRFGEKIKLIPYKMNSFLNTDQHQSDLSIQNDQYNTPKYTLDYS